MSPEKSRKRIEYTDAEHERKAKHEAYMRGTTGTANFAKSKKQQ